MAHLQTELQQLLKTISPDAAKKLRATQVKNVYKEAVMELWPEAAALFILRNTNSCFIDRQKVVDAQGNLRTRVVFGLYLSDSTVRTELDNRTPHLLMKMQERGINADQVQLLSAKMNMRKRKLFPELDETAAGSAGAGAGAAGARATGAGFAITQTEDIQSTKSITDIVMETAETSAAIKNEAIAKRFTEAMMTSLGITASGEDAKTSGKMGSGATAPQATTPQAAASQGVAPQGAAPHEAAMQMSGANMSESQLLELFKKALILTIEEVDQCAAVLDHIGGASIKTLDGSRDDDARTKDARYRIKLYVRELDAMQAILSYFDQKLIKNCWRQGLRVVRIEMYAVSPFLERQRAFPAQGDPIPLQHYYAQGVNPME